jgi:PGAP1-like protein
MHDRYPPVALQPSLGHFFSHVNGEWKKGYNTDKSHGIFSAAGTRLSNVIVVSIAGGVHDYQVFLMSFLYFLCSTVLYVTLFSCLMWNFFDLLEPQDGYL